MLRAIREIKPVWVVGENVRGLISWNGGMVFDEVQADLETEGYEIIPFLLPACAVNAPHQRERIWFIAYSQSLRSNRAKEYENNNFKSRNQRRCNANNSGQVQKWNPVADSNSIKLQGWGNEEGSKKTKRFFSSCDAWSTWRKWQNFPTQSPIRKRNDGVSDRMVKYLTKELLNEISKTSQENRIENLQEVWSRISQKEIWEEIRRFYSLESKEILYETMQLYSTGKGTQIGISPFSENFSEPILRHLRKYKEFRCSPQGQKLQKQRSGELANTLSQLPHEVALAAGRFETAISKFDSWHRSESIKAYGNAIVPQVAYNIFKAIEQYDLLNP